MAKVMIKKTIMKPKDAKQPQRATEISRMSKNAAKKR